jgi:precorrin-2/cobalt-factor-2 C20-methyltransferase
MTSGTLYGVGVGPGDVELMTLKAARLLREVDLIAYPRANGEESFARLIAAPLLDRKIPELPFTIAMRKPAAVLSASYDAAAARLAEHLRAAKNVAVLCEGDPFFYGSFIHVYDRLADRFPTVVVPGVTSLTACAASLRRPLAAGSGIFKVVPATVGETRLRHEIDGAETLAIIKVGVHFDRVRRLLSELRLIDRAAIVERSTLSDERVTPLSEAPPGPRTYFSTVLVYKGEGPPQ